MDRQDIITLMKTTATANGGKPLGRLRFESEAGVKEHHWSKHWPRYNELVIEAGFAPNTKTTGYSRTHLVELLAAQIRKLGRFPSQNEIAMIGPSEKTFRTHFGSKRGMLAAVREHCQNHAGHEDILALCPIPVPPETNRIAAKVQPLDCVVYLMKAGKYYKIGKTNHVGGRERDLRIQLPDPIKTVHSITTDDPNGIEVYWHRRFAGKRKNGEWFELSPQDVAAFRRRKFM